MKKKTFIRSYPDTWQPRQVFLFIQECKRVGTIPSGHKLKVKHNKRKGTKTLTFTWKV